MALLTIQRLIEEADGGKKLTTEERRRAVAYLMSTNPSVQNTDMAARFQVSEGTIRKDKEAIRLQMAKEVKEDDIGLVIADILWDFRRQIGVLEESLQATKVGTGERRKHAESIMKLRLSTVAALQDLGYLPKNLGSMTKEIFEYAAVVIKDGSVDSRPLNLFDESVQREIKHRMEIQNTKQLPSPDIIDADVEDAPVSPSREVVYEESTTGVPPANIQSAATGKEA